MLNFCYNQIAGNSFFCGHKIQRENLRFRRDLTAARYRKDSAEKVTTSSLQFTH